MANGVWGIYLVYIAIMIAIPGTRVKYLVYTMQYCVLYGIPIPSDSLRLLQYIKNPSGEAEVAAFSGRATAAAEVTFDTVRFQSRAFRRWSAHCIPHTARKMTP